MSAVMKQVVGYPPNHELILLSLTPPKDAVFCFGDTIYNPTNKTLTADVQYHETIHRIQQGADPNLWWNCYLTDKEFRLAQELEAYSSQFAFACKHIKQKKLVEWVKEKMAMALSGEGYGNLISYGEAESKIRNYEKAKN